MNRAVEEWDRQARAANSEWEDAAVRALRRSRRRRKRSQQYRDDRWWFRILAVLMVIGLLCTAGAVYAQFAHARQPDWRYATASVYDGSGTVAMPGQWHPRYGVAHRWLPFRASVRICLRRCVTARVNDRGPFIEGREFDLTLETAAAIGSCVCLPRVRYRVLR